MILSLFLWSYPFSWNPHFICNLWLIFSTGMVNCRVSISRKQQIGLERKRFTSGGGVMTYLHPMARVWKCVLKEQLLISKIMYAWLCFLFLVLLWFACQWLDGFLNDSSNCIPFNSIWHKSTCRLNLNFYLGRMWWLLPMGIHWGPSSCTLTN